MSRAGGPSDGAMTPGPLGDLDPGGPSGDHDHQHGAAAPVDPRGAATPVGARRRDGVSCTPIVGYLHTGIEKNTEYRTWQQGVTFVTRADYLSPFFNEVGYCLAVEKLLGIEAPPRAQVLRVLFCEMNRIASHLVWLATSGLELGAVSMMLYGFREREQILDIFEAATGLRMNHAYVRIGGVRDGSARRRDGADRRLPPDDARPDRRVRAPAHEEPDLAPAQRGVGSALGRGRARARRHRADAPSGRRRPGRPARRAVLRVRDLRVRRRHPRRGRLLRAIPGPDRGDAPVPAYRRAVPGSPARARPGDGGGPQGRAGRRSSRWGPTASAIPRLHHAHHGGVDGGPDPSLQDGDRGRLRPAGRGVRAGRVAPRRARLLRRLRRRQPSLPREDARPVVRQPPGGSADGPRAGWSPT